MLIIIIIIKCKKQSSQKPVKEALSVKGSSHHTLYSSLEVMSKNKCVSLFVGTSPPSEYWLFPPLYIYIYMCMCVCVCVCVCVNIIRGLGGLRLPYV